MFEAVTGFLVFANRRTNQRLWIPGNQVQKNESNFPEISGEAAKTLVVQRYTVIRAYSATAPRLCLKVFKPQRSTKGAN